MAIYYYDARIVSRGAGRRAEDAAAYQSAQRLRRPDMPRRPRMARHTSALQASAYQSSDRLTDGRDGTVYDYGRAERVASTGIELPSWVDGAMRGLLSDRQSLWSAVEAAETSDRAQLARRVIVAIPRELSTEQREALVVSQARAYADSGMAVDWAIHGDPDDRNPHAHMLLTMRPLARPEAYDPARPESAFVPDKTGKEYEVRRGAETRWVPARDWQVYKAAGWDKVYNYCDPATVVRSGSAIDWRKTACMHLTRAEGDARGWQRRSKQPISRRSAVAPWEVGTDGYKDALQAWRRDWEDRCNTALEAAGTEERVDCRSYEERGIGKVPQRHLGPRRAAMERAARDEAEHTSADYGPVTEAGRANARALAANAARALESAVRVVAAARRAVADAARAAMEAMERAARDAARRRAWRLRRRRGHPGHGWDAHECAVDDRRRASAVRGRTMDRGDDMGRE